MLTSWLALSVAVTAGFVTAWMLTIRGNRAPVVCGAVCLGFLAWLGVIVMSWFVGWSGSSEALFHHGYVMGVVGVPVVGVVLWCTTMGSGIGAGPVGARRLLAVVCVLPAAVGIYATHIEPEWLRVDHVVIGDVGDAVPLRIGVIADIQTDAFGRYEDEVIEAMTAEEPDIVFVAGDITQVAPGEYRAVERSEAKALAGLRAPSGVLVISGNTDPSASSVDALAVEAGLTPLNDAVTEFVIDDRRVRVLGIGWPNNRRARVNELLDDFVRTARPDVVDIVLAHSPDVVLNMRSAAGVDLVVSGHTHGGQIRLPIYGPIWNVTELPDEVAAGGLHVVDGVPLYVSTGVGVQRGDSPKVRFGVRPSIGLIEVN